MGLRRIDGSARNRPMRRHCRIKSRIKRAMMSQPRRDRSSTVHQSLARRGPDWQHGWKHDEPAIAGDRPASSPDARARSGASRAHRRGSGSEEMRGNEHGPRRSRFLARRAGEVCTRRRRRASFWTAVSTAWRPRWSSGSQARTKPWIALRGSSSSSHRISQCRNADTTAAATRAERRPARCPRPRGPSTTPTPPTWLGRRRCEQRARASWPGSLAPFASRCGAMRRL
mmetsp:Transcript_55065/g.151525  ORF Transcript_55065/g.151525 Transcript_55065/m.151525 type:complete len:228 (-) Transcript_55065:822-1505(-)